eukprot:350486-Chlamydomonas_euryale.AAC.4
MAGLNTHGCPACGYVYRDPPCAWMQTGCFADHPTMLDYVALQVSGIGKQGVAVATSAEGPSAAALLRCPTRPYVRRQAGRSSKPPAASDASSPCFSAESCHRSSRQAVPPPTWTECGSVAVWQYGSVAARRPPSRAPSRLAGVV